MSGNVTFNVCKLLCTSVCRYLRMPEFCMYVYRHVRTCIHTNKHHIAHTHIQIDSMYVGVRKYVYIHSRVCVCIQTHS